ncbi:hypothetical protein Pcinc_007655 [Petrolisthes cinctipes]|uniref:Reverse transcriptase domain-containing protein n=1 Tax=Petrolisthes cinctipes TaxID=88211 RepID=A0AAE1G812_PETCI|nr:hypothetical protein Pcinc_007655 [Petrolisthes cinctipes]
MFRFRAGRSCLTQLLAHYEKVLTSLENKKDIDVVYLEFAKAFDKVDHGILLYKPRQMGISGKLGRWLHSFLTSRKQVLATEGAQSAPMLVTSGVPHFSLLGPLLFIAYNSDIDQNIQHSFVSLFTDDTRVLQEISLSANAELLQADLKSLYQWAEKNNMMLNGSKFEHMSYTVQGCNNCPPKYTANDRSQVSVKPEVKGLGVTLSCDGNFTSHINHVTKMALSQAGWFLRMFRTHEPEPMLTLYKPLVVPLLEYCCQLWSSWYLRNCNGLGLDNFKLKLDKFLGITPDEPKLPQYHLRASRIPSLTSWRREKRTGFSSGGASAWPRTELQARNFTPQEPKCSN